MATSYELPDMSESKLRNHALYRRAVLSPRLKVYSMSQEQTGAVDADGVQSSIKEALLANGIHVDDVDLLGPLAYVEQVSYCQVPVSALLYQRQQPQIRYTLSWRPYRMICTGVWLDGTQRESTRK